MSAKKLISKVKTLHKKVAKEIRKKNPDFTAIGQHLTAQSLLISKFREKINAKVISKVKAKKITAIKKKKPVVRKAIKKR